MAKLYRAAGDEKTSASIYYCANQIDLGTKKDGSHKITRITSCRQRFCPNCAYRRSIKIYAKIAKVVNELKKDANIIFITLTIKNVNSQEISKGIDSLNSGYQELIRKLKKYEVKGYIKTIEVTYNSETKTYHPHIHILMDIKNYIPQKSLVKLWQNSAKLDYLPVCDIRKVQNLELQNAVAETAKYMTKFSIFKSKLPDKEKIEILQSLSNALHSRKLLSSSGTLKIRLNENLSDEYIKSEIVNISSFEWIQRIQKYIKIDY